MPTTASWISKRPNYCGGDACIRDTRITVWGIIAYRRLGMSDARILEAIQGLTPADLEAAWAFAAAHAEEIDRDIREDEEGEELVGRTAGGKLPSPGAAWDRRSVPGHI